MTPSYEKKQTEKPAGKNAFSKSPPVQENVSAIHSIEIPQLSLPTGGGALRSIDEKFQVNAANGTATLSIPLPISPGRQGFQPALNLVYNSGAGNSAFGIGWNLDLQSIQIKSDKNLPKYLNDNTEYYTISGADDLVPALREDGPGNWQLQQSQFGEYQILRYRPRIEGGFQRIERITHPVNGIYWKVTAPSNRVIFFGSDPGSRIADPDHPEKIYRWLPCFAHDDLGNWMQYEYQSENADNVPNTGFEKNRTKATNVYLKRIRYGNRQAFYPDTAQPYDCPAPTNVEHFFELVMDYGAHDIDFPLPAATPGMTWDYREDAFSSYRAGFEIRTRRLCKRILLFHHFKDEADFGENVLVRALELTHSPSSINQSGQAEVTYLSQITESGFIKTSASSYSKRSFPAQEFSYQKVNWDDTVQTIEPDQLSGAPSGLEGNYQWVDLYGEGISGILTEQGPSLLYKSNLGPTAESHTPQFTAALPVMNRPNTNGLFSGGMQLQDLEANGARQLVVEQGNLSGYFELSAAENWDNFIPFESQPQIDKGQKNLRRIDLDGDGQTELLIMDQQLFIWYPSLGKKGYEAAKTVAQPIDEEQGPGLIFTDSKGGVHLADMTGDGLLDIVRIRPGAIDYWANMGYGKFSSKISMSHPPLLDHIDQFNADHLYLADISGSGTTDIIYVRQSSAQVFFNLSGNSWSEKHLINGFFPSHDRSRISVIDLLGMGTSCLVWSSALPMHQGQSMRYIDLMKGQKPHLLQSIKNNMGKEVHLEYRSSTFYYLNDKAKGRPWITKLPFPVQVISKMTLEEKVTNVKFSTLYSYHHGYYDHEEKEFRGFGRVEQQDTAHYPEWKINQASTALEQSEALYQKPVLIKTWYHTGAYIDAEKILTHFASEYWNQQYNQTFPDSPLAVSEPSLPDALLQLADTIEDPNLLESLTAAERRQALRACKGMMLRQEIFALDAPADNPDEAALQLQAKPYSVALHNCHIRLLQPSNNLSDYAVFFPIEGEAIQINYERNEADPRLMHSINLAVNAYGQILEQASISYGRNNILADAARSSIQSEATNYAHFDESSKLQIALNDQLDKLHRAQTQTNIIYQTNQYTNYDNGSTTTEVLDIPTDYRLPVLNDQKTYEILNLSPSSAIYRPEDFLNILTGGSTEIAYTATPSSGTQRRLIEQLKTLFYDEALTGALASGRNNARSIPYETYQLAFTSELIEAIYKDASNNDLLADGSTVEDRMESLGGYIFENGNYWIRSGKIHYLDVEHAENISHVKNRFFAPTQYEDALGSFNALTYDIETFSATGKSNNDAYYLFVAQQSDALGNRIMVDEFNYRTLSPSRLMDANANPSSVLRDELGLVKAMAIEGNGYYDGTGNFQLEQADSVDGLSAISTAAEANLIQDLLTSDNSTDLMQAAATLLGTASQRFIYNLNQYTDTGLPNYAIGIERVQHHSENANSELILNFSYSDGLGNVVLEKTPTDPGEALVMEDGNLTTIDTSPNLRWIGNGRIKLNNKGNPVKQYEPYFSTNFDFESDENLVEIGVSPIVYYDAPGRVIKTEFPNGTTSQIVFNAWQQQHFDQNDTVLQSSWYEDRINRTIDAALIESAMDPIQEAAAAVAVEQHDDSPNTIFLDSLARPVLTLAHNGYDRIGKAVFLPSFIELDIEGNPLNITDPRGNTSMQFKYNCLGNSIYEHSLEKGRRWTFSDVLGNPINHWDERDHVHHFSYDDLHRPTAIRITGGPNSLDNIYQKIRYGENSSDDQKNNLRLQVFTIYDTAGKITNTKFDFKGNLLEDQRQFTSDYKSVVDWSAANPDSLLDHSLGPYTSFQSFDALNRTAETTAADGTITNYEYNPGNLLKRVSLTQTNVTQQAYVEDIDYNEKGQRKSINYGNGVQTFYTYDPLTFRLVHLQSVKINGDVLQDLQYTYDPIGNIICQQDKSIPTQFFSGTRIQGKNEYSYDALNRLIEAKGREHAGQQTNFSKDNFHDLPFLKSYNANDPMAWRNYTQTFDYDAASNLLTMDHKVAGAGSASANWTRINQYHSKNNRLNRTQIGGHTFSISHDNTHGFINSLPHLTIMDWNFRDELVTTSQQLVNSGTPETTYYVYDGNGQRVRKITENQGGGSIKDQRLYLESVEIYKKETGNHAGLERYSFHLVDDQRRVAMIDTRNTVNDGSPLRTQRYQLSNHLGSAALELDSNAAIISYEEYHPFGTTAYQATSNSIQVAAKRYRYSGMERDEETGMNYHAARYYLPWLGRWLSPDPSGISDGLNIYEYVGGNPIILVDLDGRKRKRPPGYFRRKFSGEEVQQAYSELMKSQLFRDLNNDAAPKVYSVREKYKEGKEALKTQIKEFIEELNESKLEEYEQAGEAGKKKDRKISRKERKEAKQFMLDFPDAHTTYANKERTKMRFSRLREWDNYNPARAWANKNQNQVEVYGKKKTETATDLVRILAHEYSHILDPEENDDDLAFAPFAEARNEIFAELFSQLILCEIEGKESCDVSVLVYGDAPDEGKEDKRKPLPLSAEVQAEVNAIYQSGASSQEKAVAINELVKAKIVQEPKSIDLDNLP